MSLERGVTRVRAVVRKRVAARRFFRGAFWVRRAPRQTIPFLRVDSAVSDKSISRISFASVSSLICCSPRSR